MRRAFSRRARAEKAQPVVKKPFDDIQEDDLLPALPEKLGLKNSRSVNGGRTYGSMLSRHYSVGSGGMGGGLQRSLSKREKIVRAITNPDVIFRPDPYGPPPESRFNPNPNGKILRTFFSNTIDIAPTPHIATLPSALTAPLPHPELPLFSTSLISPKVASEMPLGYYIRPLCRSDHSRGYMEVAKVLGKTAWVPEEEWNKRCEWLRGVAETYFVIVVVDGADEVVASGTLIMERKFTHNFGILGHVEDIAVARNQKGKKMGLRVLEALVYAAEQSGCYKTVVNCNEQNEAFHAQAGFSREGSMMAIQHGRKSEGNFI